MLELGVIRKPIASNKVRAAQYCSSVRGYFNNKFRNEDPIPILHDDKQWSKLMTKLRGKYREANRASGKPTVEGNESSTREDRRTDRFKTSRYIHTAMASLKTTISVLSTYL